MKKILLTLALSCLSSSAFAGDKYLVYFGTGTNAQNGSKGIYVGKFDASTGALTQPELAAVMGSPGFLAIHPSKKYLYAVGDVATADGKKGGGIRAFSIDAKSGALTTINEASGVGSGPCHVSVDSTGKVAALANYGSGSTVSFAIKPDGRVSESVSFLQHEGSSINPDRQKGPHAHSVNFSPDNRFALACDLGIDKVLVFKVDTESGKLTPNDPASAKTPAGGGPRHLAFHPSGKYVFVNNELTMSASSFAWDAAKGALTEIGTVSTLPEADRDKTGFSTAEILAHSNGKVVYVSNRTHDTVAVLKCDPSTGKLELIQNVPVEGKIPRNICLDPTGKWLIAAHQNSGTAAVFKVDAESGKLTFTGTKVTAPGAICVRFVPQE